MLYLCGKNAKVVPCEQYQSRACSHNPVEMFAGLPAEPRHVQDSDCKWNLTQGSAQQSCDAALGTFFTEIFPLGQVCFAMFMPRKDQIPLFSAREELITGWPFHQTQFFPHWLCCPCHLCMSSLTSLISTVWRSWHPPPGEWGHAFVTHSCAAALFNGFNYIIFWVCFASVPRQKLLGDGSLHSALALSRQSTDHHQL